MDRRLLILGLDGATFDVLDPLVGAGRCPTLAGWMAGGVSAALLAPPPPMTATGWSAFLTGQGPGGSGIASFRRLDLSRYSGYDPRMATSADLRGRNWLERVSDAGVSVSAVGVPMTWPPFPTRGVLVSGFPRPPSRRAPVLPAHLGARWGRWDRPADASSRHLGEADRPIACRAWDRRHTEVSLDLLRSRRDRAHVCVYSGSDHMAHLFWGREPGVGPAGAELEAHYEFLDEQCRVVSAAVQDDTDVLVISDHGFGAAETRTLHLDRWLAERGWLVPRDRRPPDPVARISAEARARVPKAIWKRWRDRLPGGLKAALFDRATRRGAVDWERTRAYRVGLYQGWEGIHLNVLGRQPRGCVPPGAAWREERARLAEDLRGARDGDGSPLVEEVRDGESAWPGGVAAQLPDLLVRLAPPLRGGGGLPPGPVVEPVAAAEHSRVRGTHRPAGIAIGWGPSFAARGRLPPVAMVDIMPTVLHLLGQPVPVDAEGSPLLDWLGAGATTEAVARCPAWPGPPASTGRPMAPGERRAIRERLRALGYIDGS